MAKIIATKLIKRQQKEKKMDADKFVKLEQDAFKAYQERRNVEFRAKFSFDIYRGIECDFDMLKDGKLLVAMESDPQEKKDEAVAVRNEEEAAFVQYMNNRRVVIYASYVRDAVGMYPIIRVQRMAQGTELSPDMVKLQDEIKRDFGEGGNGDDDGSQPRES